MLMWLTNQQRGSAGARALTGPTVRDVRAATGDVTANDWRLKCAAFRESC